MLNVDSNVDAVAQVDTGADINADTLISGVELDGLSVGSSNDAANGGRQHEEGRSETHGEEF